MHILNTFKEFLEKLIEQISEIGEKFMKLC